jgi:hypothetical protein
MRSTLAFERRGRQHASVHLRFPPSAIQRFRLAGSRGCAVILATTINRVAGLLR